MKKSYLPILLALMIACASAGYTQTPSSTTVPSGKATLDTLGTLVTPGTPGTLGRVPADQTVTFLIEQNEKARQLITAQDAHIKDLEAELAAERENGESLSKSYSAAQAEIDALKSANDSLHKAVSLYEQTISLLTTDRDKWKDKAKHERNAKLKAYAVAAGLIAVKFLLP